MTGTTGPVGPAIASNFTIRGNVSFYSGLEAIAAGGAVEGDAYVVEATQHVYIWVPYTAGGVSGYEWVDAGVINGPTGPTGPMGVSSGGGGAGSCVYLINAPGASFTLGSVGSGGGVSVLSGTDSASNNIVSFTAIPFGPPPTLTVGLPSAVLNGTFVFLSYPGSIDITLSNSATSGSYSMSSFPSIAFSDGTSWYLNGASI